jgi:hypothetical protein
MKTLILTAMLALTATSGIVVASNEANANPAFRGPGPCKLGLPYRPVTKVQNPAFYPRPAAGGIRRVAN